MVVRRIQENPNELYHHGVKGMRWGHRKQRILLGRRRGRNPYHQESSQSSAPKRQRSGAQRISDSLAKKSTKRIITAGVIGLTAATGAKYVRDYLKRSGGTKINSSDAKIKFKVAEEWADRVMNGEKLNYKDFADNRFREMRNFAGNFRASYRKNRYALPG